MRLGSIISGVGLAGAAGFGVALKSAAELQETMGKFNTVFGESADEMSKWATETADAMGVSQEAMHRMLSGLQDLFVPMGVTSDRAADMSKELSKLAIDLGSFNNLDSDTVMRDLMAAVTGSGETMKKYGVIVDEAAVKQELLNTGLDKKTATNAQKAQARLAIIMRGTTAAQGDAIRTADSYTNQMKRLWAVINDTTAAIGGAFIDDIAKLVGKFVQVAKATKSWVEENQVLIKTTAKVVAVVVAVGAGLVAMGGVLIGLGATFGAISAIITGVAAGFTALVSVVSLLLSPMVLFIATIAAGTVYFLRFTEAGQAVVAFFREKFASIADIVRDTMGGVFDAIAAGDLAAAWDIIVTGMETIWLELTNNIMGWWDSAMNAVGDVGVSVAQSVGNAFVLMADLVNSAFQGIIDFYSSALGKLGKVASLLPGDYAKGLGIALGASGKALGGLESEDTAIGEAMSKLRDFGNAMGDAASQRNESSKADRESRAKERQQRLDELKTTLAAQREKAGEDRKEAEAAAKEKGDAGGLLGGGSGKSFATFSARAALALSRGSETPVVRKLDRVEKAIHDAAAANADQVEDAIKNQRLVHP